MDGQTPADWKDRLRIGIASRGENPLASFNVVHPVAGRTEAVTLTRR